MSSCDVRSLLYLLLLLLGCSAADVARELPDQSNRSTVIGSEATTQPSPPPKATVDICGICNCSDKVIRCDNKNKLSDVLKIHIPENYNILDLSTNFLTRIHESSFIEGVDVTEVNLAYNQISSIADFAFAALKNLTRLTLLHNHLASLEDNSFAGLPRLENLDLSMNKFKRFNPEYLAPLTNLKYLNLDNNYIEGLYGSVFRNNTRLTHLRMNKLGIDRLDDSLFQYTPHIQVLHLDDNFFETVPSKALSKLSELEILTLSGNPIVFLGPMSFPELPKLQQLVLQDMQHLLRIEIFAFSNLPMLRTLKVQNCDALLYIDPKAFVFLTENDTIKYPNIKHLVIHDTAITTLSEQMLIWDDIDELDIANNKFHCNCNFSWAVNVVKDHDVNLDIRCHSPQRLAGHIIGRLKSTDMLCDDYSPLNEAFHLREQSHSTASTGSKAFSVLLFVLIVIFSTTLVFSILFIVSVKRRGFLYRKLGKPQPVYAGGENVLYMRTTIDNY